MFLLINNNLAWDYLSVYVSLETQKCAPKSFAERYAPGANKIKGSRRCGPFLFVIKMFRTTKAFTGNENQKFADACISKLTVAEAIAAEVMP